MIDYYEILEVSPRAGQDVIRAAYNILMQRYDPENDSNAPETAQMILAIELAYEVLSDTEKRKAYDIELGKARHVAVELSRNHHLDERAANNISDISPLKPDQAKGKVRSKSNVSYCPSVISRLNWKRWGWILSILAVIVLLFSMVQPEPEKVKRGQLAVQLEAERQREELESKVRKKAAEVPKTDALENENEGGEAGAARTNIIDSAP